MAWSEVICGNCGAINRDALEPCWRCLEALVAEPGLDPAREPVAALLLHHAG
jgi:hypothetical protein